MPSTYSDIFAMIRQPSGIVLANTYANAFRFAIPQPAGTTRLNVPANAVTTTINAYDQVYLFDGLNSEIVQVSTAASPGASSLSLVNPTQFTHQAGVSACTDSTQGSLAAQIFTASQWIEDICRQSLYVSTYSGEVLSMPSMRAAIDKDEVLWFRPRHFPITSLTALSIQTSQQFTVTYDPTQAIIDSERLLVSIPTLNALGSTQATQAVAAGYTQITPLLGRNTRAWLTITYNSGYTALPSVINRACALLTGVCFAQMYNSIGADQVVEGERNVTYTMRGDQSGESLLEKEAKRLLQPYVMEEN